MSLSVLAVVPERPGSVGERPLHAERRVRHRLRLQAREQQRHGAARVRADGFGGRFNNLLLVWLLY